MATELTELSAGAPGSLHGRQTTRLQQQACEIAADIQTLSHALHSSRLELLGVAPAMRSFCDEFADQQHVEVDFAAHDVPDKLPPEVSLCLFRVLQEALRNSAKHSGVRHFEVQLWGARGEINLVVGDPGEGFNLEAASTGRGLGLVSMQERMKLVDGDLSIETRPQRGTRIHARAPWRSGASYPDASTLPRTNG